MKHLLFYSLALFLWSACSKEPVSPATTPELPPPITCHCSDDTQYGSLACDNCNAVIDIWNGESYRLKPYSYIKHGQIITYNEAFEYCGYDPAVINIDPYGTVTTIGKGLTNITICWGNEAISTSLRVK